MRESRTYGSVRGARDETRVPTATVLFCCTGYVGCCAGFRTLCRFSDAGNDELAMRSGDRRPKSAKARNRGRYARSAVPLAQLWGFEQRACRVDASARREVEGLRTAKHAEVFAVTRWEPQKRGWSGSLLHKQRVCAS